MKPSFHIRQGSLSDASAIARLSIRESRRHIRADCSEAGFRELLASLVSQAVEARLRGGIFRYWVAEESRQIHGVCALREATHLYHLFVATEQHGQGIARQLWETARGHSLASSPPSSLDAFTVNASTFALPFYARLGFQRNGDASIKNGIRSWPMILPASQSR